MSERIEIKGISPEDKNSLKLKCEMLGKSVSSYVLELIKTDLEEDNEMMEFDNESINQVVEEIEIEKFEAHIPEYKSQKDRIIVAWVEKEVSRILSSYSGKGYNAVDNLYIAEALVKSHGWRCLRVVKDHELNNKKSWILVEGEKTDNLVQ